MIIKQNGKLNELDNDLKPPVLKIHELIEEQSKQRLNKEIKEKLNLTILPNLNSDTKIFMNLDVQYDFIPSNEEYLRKMRLDFITKKDKIVNFIRKNLTRKSHKQLFIKNSFQNDYQEWLKRTDSELHGGGSSRKVERFDIWNNKKKRKSIDDTGYEREAELFKQNESDIPEANFNHYTRQFFYHKKALNKIEDVVMYDLNYKESDLWSLDDIKLFITQYLSYPKDFETISSIFYNKTTRDIINFYFNFKHHFQLQKYAEEVYGPNYIRKHISKKIEYINEVADSIVSRINSEFIKNYEEYSQSKFSQPLTRFTSYQLLKIFAHLSASRSDHQVKKMEQIYEDAKRRDTKHVIKVEYNDSETIPSTAIGTYYADIERNGTQIEQRLLQNQDLEEILNQREQDIYRYTPVLSLTSKHFRNVVPQRKICERTQPKNIIKTQEIKMEEEDDFDAEFELYHGRYQSKYLVVEKEFPKEIPADDESLEHDSQSSHSVHVKTSDFNGNNDIEKSAQTYEMGISTSHVFVREEKSENLKQSDRSQTAKKSINNDSSNSHSSERNDNKQSSNSSKNKDSKYPHLHMSKSASERRSMAHWVESEKSEFKKQLSIHGKDWKRIAKIIKNKTEKQIRNFYQNYKKKMNLEELLPDEERVSKLSIIIFSLLLAVFLFKIQFADYFFIAKKYF